MLTPQRHRDAKKAKADAVENLKSERSVVSHRSFVCRLALLGLLCAAAPAHSLCGDKEAYDEELIGTWELESCPASIGT